MYSLLIPKENSIRSSKSGRGGLFWQKFWENNVLENIEFYQQNYERQQSRLQETANNFVQEYQEEEKKYYLEATLSDFASSKSKEPIAIWSESGVQIVESRKDGNITLSGFKDDFQRLSRLIQDSKFNNACRLEQNTKENRISREVFAVTAFADKNTSYQKRISKGVSIFLENLNGGRIECILVVYYDVPFREYDNLYSILVSKITSDRIEKVNPDLFVHNMIFKANLSGEEIKSVLSDVDCNFLKFVKTTTLCSTQRTIPNTNTSAITISEILTDEIAVIIDSGIDHSLLSRFVVHRENLVDSSKRHLLNKSHGTEVCSKMIYGENLFKNIEEGNALLPVSKVIDIQTLYNINGKIGCDSLELDCAISKSVQKYHSRATIFNLSIAYPTEVDENVKNDSTVWIDSLSNKYDVLFVCAVGNHDYCYSMDYENIFDDPTVECKISPPSDALNAISVGSISKIVGTDSMCSQNNHPAPFTRKGGIGDDLKKPEVVASGGNCKIDNSGIYNDAHKQVSNFQYGVSLMSIDGLTKNIGTSYSAPLVARQAILLLDYLKKSNIPQRLDYFSENKANLVKALLIHSTSRVNQARIQSGNLKRAYGFGMVDFERVIRDDEDQITMIYADKINYNEKKHRLLVNIPNYLLGKEVEFTLTFVYNPPVNDNFKEYKMIELRPSIGFVYPEIENGAPTGKMLFKSENPSKSWNAYRNPNFSTWHFTKKKKEISLTDLQIMVQMTVSNQFEDEYMGSLNEINQNYAIILTIRDTSGDGRLRTEMINTNQFFELIENVNEVQISSD